MSNKRRKKTVLIDRILGEIAFYMLQPFMGLLKKKEPQSFKRILIIKTGGIGDYLLSIPVFKKIRATYPEAEITMFIFNRNKNCLEFYNDFNKVVVIDDPVSFIKFLFGFKRYDLSIDFDQYRKIPSLLSIFSYARVRIGFDHAGKGHAYTDKVPYRLDEYEAQSFMNLLRSFGISKAIEKSDLIMKTSSEKIPNSVAIYACAMKEDNRLPIVQWVDIIKRKGDVFTYYFIGGKADRERYDELQAALAGFKIERTDGTLSLLGSLDLLSICEAMISEDGGTYHMGIVTGIPVTGYWLHGENNMKKWSSPDAENILLK